MEQGLENKLQDTERYKSEGERRIAQTLNQYGIPFIYEPKLPLKTDNRPTTLRPDFYLPQHNLYIEFYGRAGNQDYDKRTEHKQRTYAENNVKVLSIYPWDLVQNWPGYLIDRLHNRSIPTKRQGTYQQPRHYKPPKSYRPARRYR